MNAEIVKPDATTTWERKKAVEAVRQYFLKNHVEDPQDGTAFDLAMLDAFGTVEKQLDNDLVCLS